MPHDSKGRPLAAGDTVILTCTVTSVGTGETECNACVQVIRPPGYREQYLPTVSLNSKLVEKIDATP